jgi:DNA-binding MarR family transcriptional regulator
VTDVPTEDVHGSVGMAISRISIRLQELLRTELQRDGLLRDVQPGVGPILFALYQRDAQRVSEVADALGIARSTMTTIVSRLQRRGMVKVEPDPDDGRAKRLLLTAKARRLRPRLQAVAGRVEVVLCADARERRAVLDALGRIESHLTEARERVRPPRRGS